MYITNKDIGEINELYKTAEQANKKAEEKIKNLQEKIKKGAKSDNPIQDLVILHFSSISKKYQQVLRDFEERINNGEGKEILIAKETTFEEDDIHYLGKCLIPRPRNYRTNLELKVGMIGGEVGWNVKDGEMVIPVQNNEHLEARYEYMTYGDFDLGKFQSVEWQEKAGPIVEKDLGFLIARKLKNSGELIINRYPHVATTKILIGKEVEEYFTINNVIDDAYCKAIDLLENKIN
jgi:hypothetical protein